MESKWIRVFPSVFCWTAGKKERLLPQDILGSRKREEKLLALEKADLPKKLLYSAGKIDGNGAFFTIPIYPEERFYGLGLQMHSFLQNGKRKRLTTNADAPADTGDAHAPVPFFVSSLGYGILVDSAKTVEVDFGCSVKCGQRSTKRGEGLYADTQELYQEEQRGSRITIFIKGETRLRIYCFVAETMKRAVEQYNLFCGGGCLPPCGDWEIYIDVIQRQIRSRQKKCWSSLKERKCPFQ